VGKKLKGGDFLRRRLIAANWKMNKSIREAEDFAREFLQLIPDANSNERPEIVICPPFTALSTLKSITGGSGVKLGAQNAFWEEKGAYTGEISPSMLLDAACSYVILGHSERRQIMGESNNIINRKVKAAVEAGITPLLCVGETLQEREKNRAREVVKEQLDKCLKDINLSGDNLVVAYEPVWAIGTGVNASSDDAQEMIAFIRSCLEKIYSREEADSTRILYGGSVKEENIADFLGEADVDGALIGGASLQAESLARIVRLSSHA